ncbi:MAG TPA: glycosyltransferase family 39 protein [Opitutaceae bacterium]|nr:glycosyltransferase family 39 protein [Opitutaceae bacterium]
MIAETLVCLLLVLGVALGLSRPFIGRLGLSPAESLVAGVAFSLIGAWLYAWMVFTSGAPLIAYGLLPIVSCVFLVVGRRGVIELFRDPDASDLAVGQLVVTLWCVCFLTFIASYSGGAWTGDFVEHWQRALYFLRRWPDPLFIEQYTLTARPPLANVLAAAFMQMTGADYAHLQVVMTILASLAFLPVALIARRFGGRIAIRVAAALMMLNPLFIQNATYPWTKLQAAFFILTGLYFFLRVRDADQASDTAGRACALCLGGAILTHYSAGPYVVVMAIAWIALGFRRGWDHAFRRMTILSAAAGACVLAPWFAWSIERFGTAGTFLSNTSVSMMQHAPGNPALIILLNLRDSLIPPQLRGFQGTLFQQSSPWGSLRDQFFLIYQLNPVLALGSVGSVCAVVEAVRACRAAPKSERRFWLWSLAGVVAISFCTYGDRDHYGTGHICLQAAVLGGLAFIASRWASLGRGWRAALAAGCAADLVLGIGLQFGVESFGIDRWLAPARNFGDLVASYAVVTQGNLRWKIIAHLSYFADHLTTPPALMLALMAAILWMAVVRARSVPGEPRRP